MKNLWKYLPPFLSDTFGFVEVMNNTDGMGVVDDASSYRRRSRSNSRSHASESRVASSGIRMDDVITGTREKIMDAFQRGSARLNPTFVMLSGAPVSCMIGTDLADVADQIHNDHGILASHVDLTGHRTYEYGISRTLEAMGKLLIDPMETKPGTINLLGGTALDWMAENVEFVRQWMDTKGGQEGFSVISQWGGEESAENLSKAAQASVNLATTVAGIRMAKWMKKEFGIPYIAAAPFGKSWSQMVIDGLINHKQPIVAQKEGRADQPDVIIIGEQLMGNAIRATLKMDYGFENIGIYSFFDMEKELMEPEDLRLKSEDDLQELLTCSSHSMIMADPVYRCFEPETCCWIDIPHRAVASQSRGVDMPLLAGENLNRWLHTRIPAQIL